MPTCAITFVVVDYVKPDQQPSKQYPPFLLSARGTEAYLTDWYSQAVPIPLQYDGIGFLTSLSPHPDRFLSHKCNPGVTCQSRETLVDTGSFRDNVYDAVQRECMSRRVGNDTVRSCI